MGYMAKALFSTNSTIWDMFITLYNKYLKTIAIVTGQHWPTARLLGDWLERYSKKFYAVYYFWIFRSDLMLFITTLTLGPVLFLGLSCASFFAAASMALAALSNSFSAITLGSSGSIQSDPVWLGQRSNVLLSLSIHCKNMKISISLIIYSVQFHTLYVVMLHHTII